mgnify:FL=1
MHAPCNRRRVVLLALAGSGLAGAARAQSKVDEADETAVALGYRHDTTKVDAKKYPQHKPDQHCGNCGFWQGSASDAWAGCAMFGRKHIAQAGWCMAWKKP